MILALFLSILAKIGESLGICLRIFFVVGAKRKPTVLYLNDLNYGRPHSYCQGYV